MSRRFQVSGDASRRKYLARSRRARRQVSGLKSQISSLIAQPISQISHLRLETSEKPLPHAADGLSEKVIRRSLCPVRPTIAPKPHAAVTQRQRPLGVSASGRVLGVTLKSERPQRESRCGRSVALEEIADETLNDKPTHRLAKPRHGGPGKRCRPDLAPLAPTRGLDLCLPEGSSGTNPGTIRKCYRACHAAPTNWRGNCPRVLPD